MKRLFVLALIAGATLAHAQTKKDLAQKIVVLQQAGIEDIARALVREPADVMLGRANQVLQTQVPEDKRAGITASVQAAAKKYMDEAYPIVRERALKLAPNAFGTALEQKFSEDELKQIATWMESPTSKKFAQVTGETQREFVQSVVADSRAAIDPKVAALDQAMRAAFSAAASAPAGNASGAAPKAQKAPAPAKPASK